MPRSRRPTSAIKMLLFAVVACALALCVPTTSAAMMDMPSDPVNGEMVMSTNYNFELKNGQRLRFANEATLTQFVADPSSGLGDVKMVDKLPSTGTSVAASPSSSALCPVCGMETAAVGGPQVLMKHGEQAIHTCSMFHAHQVHDALLSFQELSSTADTGANGATATTVTAGAGTAFCTGPGTTMLNGFSFFRDGRMTTPCILLWFPGWILNSRWRYIGGCLLVIACAMFNEYLLKLRRLLRKESNAKRVAQAIAATVGGGGAPTNHSEATKLLARPRALSASYLASASSTTSSSCCSGVVAVWFRGLSSDSQHLVHCVLHGATILLAYLLMLVSMTYDGVLFLCCIVGYILGYFVFGERRDAVTEMDTGGFAAV